jgi:hypothetical protein
VGGHVVHFEAVELRLTLLLVLHIQRNSISDSSGNVVDIEQDHLHRNAVATLQASVWGMYKHYHRIQASCYTVKYS